MAKKVVQVLLSEMEQELVAAAATCRGGTHVARKARALLIDWSLGALGVRGGTRGGVCGSSSGCTNVPADYFNTNALFWCCEPCATSMRARTETTAVCVLPGDIDRTMRTYVAATDSRRIAEAIREQGSRGEPALSREELVEALLRAAEAVREHDARRVLTGAPGNSSKDSGNSSKDSGNRGNNGNGLFDTLMHRFQD